MPQIDDHLWLGTESSYQALTSAMEKAEKFQAASGSSWEDELPPLLAVSDGVGTLAIEGPLVAGSAGFWRMFGVLGYEDIANALVEGLSNPDVQSFVLSINSGGGDVSGVQDLADLIIQVDKLKPVVTHTSGMMASAAYWLGSSARKLFATQTSESGSIGVISVHMERSRMMENKGVKVTIIRAGKYKALANPYEPLSDDAKAEIQAKADQLYTMFLGHVAERRGMSYQVADEKIGQGRTFLGQKAAEVGLVDSVGNYSAAVAYAKSRTKKGSANMRGGLTASVDNSNMSANNPNQIGTTPMPTPYTAEQLAALAAGVSADALDEVTTSAATATETEPTQAEEVKTETPKAAEAPSLVEFLQTQLAEANSKLMAAGIELAQLKEKSAEAQATHDGLLTIARDSVGKMSIALGGTATVADGLSAVAVLAEHARVSAIFKDKFKVGGVASTKTEDKPAAAKVSVDPLFLHAASTVTSK